MTHRSSSCCCCISTIITLTVLMCLSFVFYFIGYIMRQDTMLVDKSVLDKQILKDMYIDPEILEELSDDQKQILFIKMREEQIRRWKAWDEKLQEDDRLKPAIKKQSKKNVHFNCDADLNVIIDYITEPDEDDLKKKQEEDALKEAEERAKKESDQKRKELEAIEEKRREELKQKDEAERIRKEMEERKEEERRKTEEEAMVLRLKETKLQKEKEESEKTLLEERSRIKEEERRKEEEERRKEEETRARQEEERLKIELQKKKREEELAEEENKRKEEIYQSMKIEQEERRKREEEESKLLDDEWKEREKKAKEAEKERRNSFSYSKNEFERMRKLAKEKEELQKLRKPNQPDAKTSRNNEATTESIPEQTVSSASYTTIPPPANFGSSLAPSSAKHSAKTASMTASPKTRTLGFKRPPLPARPDTLPRPTISNPVQVTSTRDEVDMIPVKRELVKPSRPPPPLKGGNNDGSTSNKKESEEVGTANKERKPSRPPRPKSKDEVIKWYREVEFDKSSGLNDEKQAMEWFHGVITRQESERLLSNKKQGSYLVRVSERVWGYTISFKDIGRCKHFLVDTIHGGYQFFGMDQRVHKSLNELVEFHKKNPISGLGMEVLIYPCGQEKARPDYEHLFVDNVPI